MSQAHGMPGCCPDAFADLNPEGICPTLGRLDAIVMGEIENLMRRAAALGSSGARARREGDEAAADDCFRSAFYLAVDAASRTVREADYPDRLEVLRAAALMALDCGEVEEARRLIEEAIAVDPSAADTSEWTQLREVESWPDAWLIAAVRRDPPDSA